MGYLLYLCEAFGSWPDILRNVHVVLLAKSTGGYWPIALLPSIYRVWAKARLSWVRSWASQLDRAYLALGSQKSTTDVAARVLVQTEAGAMATGTEHASLHAIVDIAKCFDKVPWDTLLKAAAVSGFP